MVRSEIYAGAICEGGLLWHLELADEGSALERTQGVGFVFECAHVSIFSDLDRCESYVLSLKTPSLSLTSHLTTLVAPWTIGDTPVCHKAFIRSHQSQQDRVS